MRMATAARTIAAVHAVIRNPSVHAHRHGMPPVCLGARCRRGLLRSRAHTRARKSMADTAAGNLIRARAAHRAATAAGTSCRGPTPRVWQPRRHAWPHAVPRHLRRSLPPAVPRRARAASCRLPPCPPPAPAGLSCAATTAARGTATGSRSTKRSATTRSRQRGARTDAARLMTPAAVSPDGSVGG